MRENELKTNSHNAEYHSYYNDKVLAIYLCYLLHIILKKCIHILKFDIIDDFCRCKIIF